MQEVILYGSLTMQKLRSLRHWCIPPFQLQKKLAIGYALTLHKSADILSSLNRLQERFIMMDIE